MRSGLSSLAAVLALAAGVPALAQTVITLSPDNPVEVAIPDKDFVAKVKVKNQSLNATVRPNSPTAGVYFVYAKNTHPTQDRTLVVELRGAKGEFIAEGRAEKVPADNWKVVRFTKPAAPPAPAPAPTPPPAATAPAPVPVEPPPPPGVPVARGAKGFDLKLKLYAVDDAKGTKTEVDGGEQKVEVVLDNPTNYVTVGDLVKGKDTNTATVDLTPKTDVVSTAKLTFPGQPNGAPPPGVTGLFSVTLDKAVSGGTAAKLGGLFPGGSTPRMHLSIDGVERVAVYGTGDTANDKGVIPPLNTTAVRVLPVARAAATRPTAALAVRVETDYAASDDTLELRVRPKEGNATVEVIPLGGPRDERLWVDVAEPTKQGLGFGTRTTDWVKALDLTTARGEVQVEAVLKQKNGTASGTLSVLVDAEPPTVVGTVVGNPAKPVERVFKGDPLPVRALVTDAGSGVRKVSFVVFSKLQDDGTFPPDAVRADAVRLPVLDRKTGKPTEKLSDEWAAELPPPEKAGRYLVAVVAHDHAGNVNKIERGDPSLKVVLVDVTGAAVRGAISGVVFFGGRPQPGLFVAVGGPDGKAKAVVPTDERGKFCIDDLPPGAYTLTTLKTDSNKGFHGVADVTVEPDKTAKVTIELIRNKDGR